MNQANLNTALSYYQFMSQKNISELGQYLHPDIELISPLSTIKGIPAVLNACKGFVQIFHELKIKSQFSSDNQVMLAIDLDCPKPLGIFHTAVLMTFKDNLIVRNELFYDARPLVTKQSEIFSDNPNAN
jgi:hypothetical protein